MKRAFWLVPILAMFSLAGCAVQAGYYVPGPPPPPVVGVVGYAPGPGYVWIDGFWDWRGRYVWVPGYWGRPPRPHAVWAPGRGTITTDAITTGAGTGGKPQAGTPILQRSSR